MAKASKRVLLTTIAGGYRAYGPGENPMDFHASRFTRGQGIFATESSAPCYPLYMLAQNVDSPMVTLENPSWADFEDELLRGYDVVGITFVNRDTQRVMSMCRTVRRLAPEAKIVLGGYGVMCLNQAIEMKPEWAGLFDEVCRGEGVRWLRAYLGEDPDRPVSQLLPPQYMYPLRMRIMPRAVPCIIAGYGCANRCEFCATSHFYNGYHALADAAQIWALVNHYYRRYPDTFAVGIFEEDFLADRKRFHALRALVREGRGPGLERLNLSILTSVKSLSEVPVEQLVEAGVGSVWIGVESKFSRLEKRQGLSLEDAFSSLQAHGLTTVGSFVLGWDHHHPGNVEEDVDFFVDLEPTVVQISSLVAGPGTDLWERLKAEGRLFEDFDFEGQHLFGESFRCRGLEPGEPQRWVEEAYRRLFHRHGTTLQRSLEVWINGYQRYHDHRDPHLRRRGVFYARAAREAAATLPGLALFAPNESVRRQCKALLVRYNRVFGRMSLAQRAMAAGAVLWLLRNKVKAWMFGRAFSQPPLKRKAWRFTERLRGGSLS